MKIPGYTYMRVLINSIALLMKKSTIYMQLLKAIYNVFPIYSNYLICFLAAVLQVKESHF